MTSIIFLSYMFVTGIATGFLFLPEVNDEFIKNLGLNHSSFISLVNSIFYISFIITAIGVFIELKVNKRLISRPIIFISSFFLGISNYLKFASTTYPEHISKFIDLDPRIEYLIRGVVSAEPDERTNDTRLTLKPYYIERYKIEGFEIDKTVPYIKIQANVIEVNDGDTFEIQNSKALADLLLENAKENIKIRRNEIYAKQVLNVRLIGINTPEVGRFGKVSEPGGIEARDYLRKLIKGKKVVLYFDKEEPFDVFLRPLAVIYDIEEKNMINELMLNYEYTSKGVEGKRATQLYLFTERILKPRRVLDFKRELKGKTGAVFVKIFKSIGELYEKVAYGSHIEVYGQLLPIRRQTNPAGFDFAKHLMARGIYAQVTQFGISSPYQIKLIETPEKPTLWDYVVKIAGYTRVKILQTIRETVPYPYSAFLGGVTLGLRGGVPQWVRQEFQETGVAHVLAVSGLHVGFVHILLLMIVIAFRIPRKIGYFFIVFGLLIFTLITGASPATQRAALMSSIGQFLYTFGRFGIRKATVFTIPISAFIILLLNPMWLPHPSFILSFAAVWSLVYLSYPVKLVLEFLLKGWAFLLFFIWISFYIYALTTDLNVFNTKLYIVTVASILLAR
ncbi:MAG: ComEC/Rec2 family competence protein, partial [bacterium]|nr:ComEC/Rec2 family competence protein [bacterium]